ncbi:MAG: 4'-phosphopantetheinyl transferase superfamily protein [Myxococcales bacterium]|nr:4'-phosphopantetheinyl transferase superfamily protein [Myxococcales bacterium]MDD9967845.1 4'-phosphopantetheinyl transferase superfamily protein [Myxococcales bacterium]
MEDDTKQFLSDGGAVVYYAHPARYQAQEERERLLSLLDADERARYRRFRFDVDRLCYLVAHALTRRALSSVSEVSPEAWRFSFGKHGKPEVDNRTDDVSLRFNLSHTRGLVACAVAFEVDVGVDVEQVTRNVEIGRVSRSVLSAPELDDLANEGDEAGRRACFFRFWTLKEAYIKAVGAGLGMPLRRIAFDVSQPAAPRITFSGIDDDPEAWLFYLCEPTPEHQLAIAVRNRASRRPQVTAFEL